MTIKGLNQFIKKWSRILTRKGILRLHTIEDPIDSLEFSDINIFDMAGFVHKIETAALSRGPIQPSQLVYRVKQFLLDKLA